MKFFKINYKTLKIIGGGTISVLAMVLVVLLPSCNKNPMEVGDLPEESSSTISSKKLNVSNYVVIERVVDAVYYKSGSTCFRWGWPPISKKYYYIVDTRMTIYLDVPRNALIQYLVSNISINNKRLNKIGYSYRAPHFLNNCSWCRILLRAWSCGYAGDRFGTASLQIEFYDARGALLSRVYSNTEHYIIFRRIGKKPDSWENDFKPDTVFEFDTAIERHGGNF